MEGALPLVDREAWAVDQFGTAELGDVRRTHRLVKLAAQMAANSSGSIPQQTQSAADMKAAYRLLAAPPVTHAAVIQPHIERTRAAASAIPMLFLVQDGAQLNFTTHPHGQGLGPIGDGEQRGLYPQNVLAIDAATGLPVGLMYQTHPRRTEREPDRDRHAKRRVPLNEGESYGWFEAIRTIGPPPEGVRWVPVGDGGEGLFGVHQECRVQGADWLIRAARDRTVRTPQGPDKLFEYARRLPRLGTRRVTVRNRVTGQTREVVLSIAAGPVTLTPSIHEPAYRDSAPIWCGVVRAWEADPPDGVERVEWMLLTSLPCQTARQARFVAEGYSQRWQVEEFHKCEKTGCQVEARRLEPVDRLEPLIGVLSVLAVHLLRLKLVARDHPTQPAKEMFDEQMVAVMAAYLKRPARGLTVGEFWRGIGRLGGHPGRKCDGPIGWLRAWRGWQAFQLMMLGAELCAKKPSKKCG